MKKLDTIAQKNGKLLTVLPSQVLEVSFSRASIALRKKDIRVNGNKVISNVNVSYGDKIEIFLPDSESSLPELFEIIYEDDHLLIVFKKKGIEVCNGENSLLESLQKFYAQEINACHRIDRNTEGLVIFSKNQLTFSTLTNALKKGEFVHKFYLAEVFNVPPSNNSKFVGYLVKNEDESKVKIYSSPVPDSIKIITPYTIIKKSINTCLLEIELKTGKTHQIRAHLAFAGFPILGDGKYGTNEVNKKFKVKTQSLIAYKLNFDFEQNSYLSYLNEKEFKVSPSWAPNLKID